MRCGARALSGLQMVLSWSQQADSGANTPTLKLINVPFFNYILFSQEPWGFRGFGPGSSFTPGRLTLDRLGTGDGKAEVIRGIQTESSEVLVGWVILLEKPWGLSLRRVDESVTGGLTLRNSLYGGGYSRVDRLVRAIWSQWGAHGRSHSGRRSQGRSRRSGSQAAVLLVGRRHTRREKPSCNACKFYSDIVWVAACYHARVYNHLLHVTTPLLSAPCNQAERKQPHSTCQQHP